MKEQVLHNCKYHAEIRVETELVKDIELELKLNEHRMPELEVAYLNPNTKKTDITWKIKSLIRR